MITTSGIGRPSSPYGPGTGRSAANAVTVVSTEKMNRRTDPPGPLDRRGNPGNSALSLRKDAFTDDDRVVHDDPQREHERHQREHVDRDAQEVHEQEGPDE